MTTTNMELVQAKKNLSKVKAVFKVVKIVTLVITCLMFILAILAEIFGRAAFIKFVSDNALSISYVFHFFGQEFVNDLTTGVTRHYVAGYFLGAGIAFGIMATICEFVESIFKEIVEGESLFTEKALKKMKTGFILITVLTLFETGVTATVFVGLILWSIYTLFKYACVLQKESDETL